MAGLRQPVSAAQAFVLIFTAVAFGLAQHLAGSMSPVEFVLALMLLEFVVQPVSTLIHELGHGAVAYRVGAAPVSIMVGRGPWLQFSLGQMRVNFSLLPSRGVMIRGVCRYRPENLSWRAVALIALAGPMATLVEFLGGVCLTAVVWADASVFARNLMALSLIGLVSSLVVNLSPMRVSRGGNAVLVGNDGTRVRIALRRHRQGISPPSSQPTLPGFPGQPTTPGIPTTRAAHNATPLRMPAYPASTSSLPAGLEGQRDADRARTSVPPPSHA